MWNDPESGAAVPNPADAACNAMMMQLSAPAAAPVKVTVPLEVTVQPTLLPARLKVTTPELLETKKFATLKAGPPKVMLPSPARLNVAVGVGGTIVTTPWSVLMVGPDVQSGVLTREPSALDVKQLPSGWTRTVIGPAAGGGFSQASVV